MGTWASRVKYVGFYLAQVRAQTSCACGAEVSTDQAGNGQECDGFWGV